MFLQPHQIAENPTSWHINKNAKLGVSPEPEWINKRIAHRETMCP